MWEDFVDHLLNKFKDKRPVTHKVGEQEYAVKVDGTLGDPVRNLAPQWVKPAFKVQTLSGLAELIRAKVDEFPAAEVCLHVVDPLRVELVSTRADNCGRRHVYAVAQHVEGAEFKFNNFYAAEDFLIDFRRSFLFNEEAVKVQMLCSQLESGMQVNLADDGMSQSLEVKSGTTSKAGIVLPAEGITLIPWRMVRDANPVASKFLLRFKGVKDGLPLIALYEIDQVWKLDCVNSIRRWLEEHVEGVSVIA